MDIELFFLILSVLVTGGLAIKSHISNKQKDETLERKTSEIITLQNEVNLNSKKLIEAQEELLKYTIGGDSYCAIVVGDFSNDECIMKVGNLGKYPMYDVDFSIVDIDLLIKAEKENTVAQHYSEIWKHVKIGNIQAGSGQIIGTLPLNNSNERRVNIFFTARNGSFSQQVVLRKKDGNWYTAWNLVDNKGKELEKRMSKGFLNQDEPDYHFSEKPIGEMTIGNASSN